MVDQLLSDLKIASIQRNLFPPAHASIANWHVFDWHRDLMGNPKADKVHSSQSLAIDVFGTIAAAPEHKRDIVLGALAANAGLHPEGSGPSRWNASIQTICFASSA